MHTGTQSDSSIQAASMSQSTKAIDLTLELTDDEDISFPIYLSSPQTTPQRVSSAEPDEIRVIESPVQAVKRSNRPKPRRRNRHLEEDAPVDSTLGAGSSQTIPQDYDYEEALTRIFGRKVQRGKDREVTSEALRFTPGMGATSTPFGNRKATSSTRESATSSLASRRKSTEINEDNAANFRLKGATQSPGSNTVLPSSPAAPVGSRMLKAASRSSRVEEDAHRWIANGHVMEGVVGDMPSVYQSSISGSPIASSSRNGDPIIPGATSTNDSTPQPGPSRTSSRLRKKSQRAIESEETAHLFGITLRAGSATSSPKMMAVSRAGSTVSTSSRISVHHINSLARRQASAKSMERDEHPAPAKQVNSNNAGARGIDKISENVREIDIDRTVQSVKTIPQTSKRNRRRSSSAQENAETADSTPRRDCNAAELNETPSTQRRSTRTRKVTEAMKQYTEDVGPRFSTRLSRRAMPAQRAQPVQPVHAVQPVQRLPPPPPLELVHDDEGGPEISPIPNLHSEDSAANTRSGYSLPSVPPEPPAPESGRISKSTTDTNSQESTPNARSASRRVLPRKAKDRSVPEVANATAKSQHPPFVLTPASSHAVLASQPSPIPPTAEDPIQVQANLDIPFPPCSPEDGENEYFSAVDFADTKLMAACAVLDTNGNKAMTAEQIAAFCMERGWLSKE